MNDLATAIDRAAQTFIAEVLRIMQSASLQDLASLQAPRAPRAKSSGAKPAAAKPAATKDSKDTGKRTRRSLETIQGEAKRVAALVKKTEGGMRAEVIRQKTGISSKDLPRVLKEALSLGLLKSKGQKRATTYFGK